METDKRRAEFIATATQLFSQKGATSTTINDITSSMGVARSLFYHYFEDKNALTDAVIDEHVDDFIARMDDWINRQGNDHPVGARELLEHMVPIARSYLIDSNPFCTSMVIRENAPLFQQFTVRSARHLAHHYAEAWERKKYLVYGASVRHPRESYYLLAVGLISLIFREPNTSDETIVDLVADTLHIPGV